MSSKITEAENKLDALLPVGRLEQSPPGELMNAAKAWSQVVWDEAEQSGPMKLSDEEIIQGHMLAQSPVFICGVHRSGTTLVRDLLDGHPELVVLPSEGTFYTNLEFKLNSLPENERSAFLGKEWLRRLVNPINQPPYWLLGRSTNTVSPYVGFAQYIMAWWNIVDKKNSQWPHTAIVLAYASCSGNLKAKLWIDKTPANERFLDRIWQEMPNAKIIHVIREPNAVISSRKTMEPSISMRVALRDLKMSFRAAVEQSDLNGPKFMLLRYEELCEYPQANIDRMVSFLNINPSITLNQSTVAGMPTKANSSFNREAPSGQILKPDQHSRPEVLIKTEQDLIAAYIGQLAAKLNYPLAKVGSLKKLFLQLRYRLW
ncbi:MAG: sulfotransferase [Mucilaginibacter sp.]|nr:sulfotransferase [Mucilaginibacter sp.]